MRQAGEHRIDVGPEGLGDLGVAHAGENREEEDLAVVERERIEPQDVLRQKRKRRVRTLPGPWRTETMSPVAAASLLNRISEPKHQEISAAPSLRAVGPHREDDGLLHEVVGGLGSVTAHECAREPPQVGHELSDIVRAARHSIDPRSRQKDYEVLTNLAQSSAKAHGAEGPFSKF